MFHFQGVQLHFDRAREAYEKPKSYPHHVTMHIALQPGSPKVLDLTQAFAVGSFMMFMTSTAASADPYTPNPFTVQIDDGSIMTLEDLLLLNLNSRPTNITVAAAGTANVDLVVQFAGQ